ncbi:MAG TPA: response regulator [Thermoanaerobaculia bacterium]
METLALIIDEEPLIRNLMAKLLALKDIDSHQAASDEEAFQLLEEHSYNLIFLDLMLTNNKGFAVLNDIRERFPEQTQHTVLTTSGDSKFLTQLPATGWCTMLVKPFEVSEFYRIAELCLHGFHTGGVCYN